MANKPVGIIIFTGKGGAGKTTCSAATALHLSESNVRTLIVSTDPAHSLSDCYGVKLQSEPSEIASNLWGMELDGLEETRNRFDSIRHVLVNQMQKTGLDGLTAEEMVAFPGSEELFCLLRIADLKKSGQFDTIIVDTAPTGNTMRFLHFPEFLTPVRRALRVDQFYSRIMRPVASFLNIKHNMPKNNFYSSVSTLFDDIVEARQDFLDVNTYFRFVLNPDRLSLVETQRAVSFLNISGFTVDAIMVNKIFPESIHDSYFDNWKAIQKNYLKQTKDSFYPLKIFEIPLYDKEVLGWDMLNTLGRELYNGEDPASRLTEEDMLDVEYKDSEIILNVRVPFDDRDELRLQKTNQEIIVNVGPYEQKLQLPSILSKTDLVRSKLKDNRLSLHFTVN